jgi:gamma-glutamyltranspeptidase/glutathione hydrolase
MKHRGIVMSRKGMTASANALISESGIKVLQKGGNAFDACVAMANTSALVLPDMCGLGGDAFALFYKASEKKIYSMNASGPAAMAEDLEYFSSQGMHKIPNEGMLSVTVPGEAAALFEGLKRFGTLPFSQLINDACDLAENGCPASEKVVRHMHTDYDKLLRHDALRKRYLRDDKPMHPGELIYNPEYAASLKLLAENGPQEFYRGKILEKILAYSGSHGGLFTRSDFENYHAEFPDPLHVAYRGYEIYETAPVSQGVILLESLNILNQIDLSGYSANSAALIHLLTEVKKKSFNDRAEWFGDPEFVSNPIDRLLSEDYAKKCAAGIRFDSVSPVLDVIPYLENSHTTSFVAVDRWGNACSFIHSISATWGSGEEVEGTGILLNNRCSTGFNLHAGHPNCLAGGKRAMHTLNTYLILNPDMTLFAAGNTPGGDSQPQWNLQNIVNLIDYGMDPQETVEQPKWVDVQSSNPVEPYDNILKIENTVGDEVLTKLVKMGHKLNVIEPYTCSGASQIILCAEKGVLKGGSDPRADGCAVPEL